MTDKIVYFLRHGQAESNAKGFYGGQGDVALTALGEEQAKATASLLKHIRFDKVYCSDLQRAKNTAALALPGVKCEYTAQLQEVHVGDLVFKYPEECLALYGEVFEESRAIGNYVPFGGEDRNMLDARIAAFMQKLEAEALPVVGVVCHAGVIRSAARYALGDQCPAYMPVDNCSVSVFEYKNGKWRLRRWNVVTEI